MHCSIAWLICRTVLVLLTAAATTRPVTAQSNCRMAFGDSLARRELEAFARVASVPPVWDDYTLASHPLLLLADSTHRGQPGTPVCAAIWRAGASLEIIELPARPPLSTPLYGLIDLDSIGPGAPSSARALGAAQRQVPPAVARELLARGIKRIVVLPVPMSFDRLGALGAALRQAGADGVLMQADLAVHESFHLHVQFPTWLDQPRTYTWPSWDRQPERRELRDRCYGGSTEVSALLRQEHAALLAAFDALDSIAGVQGKRTVLSHARQFLQMRASRRALLDTVTIALDGQRISCARAEDALELQEGTAQWIGHATTVRAGLVTRAGKRSSYAQTQPEAFYQFAPLQLWVLEGLIGPDALRALTAALARAPDPNTPGASISGLFDRHTR
jgi:hypothetical protein